MSRFQTSMHNNVMRAITAHQALSKESRQAAGIYVNDVVTLKYQMEAIAAQKGYSKACKTAIPICKGECCKYQFPKNLTHLDFFIAIFNLSKDAQNQLVKKIYQSKNSYCPLLQRNGCTLSFEQRPVICTNAYPCFNDRSYWNEKEEKIKLLKNIFHSLESLLVENMKKQDV